MTYSYEEPAMNRRARRAKAKGALPIAVDILAGVAAIAAYVKKTERQTVYMLEKGYLPGFKMGAAWHMRPATFLRHVEQLEAEASSRLTGGRAA